MLSSRPRRASPGQEGATNVSTNDREQQLRDAYVEARGFWSDTLQSMLEVDPDFFEAYLELLRRPLANGRLEPKLKELVYSPSTRRRRTSTSRASACTSAGRSSTARPGRSSRGAAADEHDGHPLRSRRRADPRSTARAAAAAPRDQPLTDAPGTAQAASSRRSAATGTRSGTAARARPRLLRAYIDFSSLPWAHGVLEPKVKELDLHRVRRLGHPSLRPRPAQHIENALGYGATAGEVMEVLELASTIGIHT